jgi:hypothetical protein
LTGPASIGRNEKERVTRSGLIASPLLGLGLMRYARFGAERGAVLWEVEPITSMSDDEVIAAVGPTIQRYIDDDIAPAKKRTRRTSVPTTNAGQQVPF